jgi:hypothetical protein
LFIRGRIEAVNVEAAGVKRMGGVAVERCGENLYQKRRHAQARNEPEVKEGSC